MGRRIRGRPRDPYDVASEAIAQWARPFGSVSDPWPKRWPPLGGRRRRRRGERQAAVTAFILVLLAAALVMFNVARSRSW